jgi:ERCC4-type nuclease
MLKLNLIIDTREQLPLEFCGVLFGEIKRAKLDVGDYGATWHNAPIPIYFERKSIGDLFGTMTNGYERFKKEMARAKESGVKLVLLIEASMREVAKGYEHSKFEGSSMIKKLHTLHVRYDLEFHYMNDRGEMARFIAEEYQAIARNYSLNASS